MRSLAVVVLLLASVLMAETQQAVYYRAMQAEEAGDISGALAAFEEAVTIPGPYTAEIQEIIDQYKLALGEVDSSGAAVVGSESSLSFRFLGDLGFYGLHYTESGWVEKISEDGGDLYFSNSAFLDYTVGDYIHSFGLSATVDWFFDNEDMPALDTNDWKLSLGLEYTLVAPTFLVDLGVDFNAAQGESFDPAFYGWFEKDFFKLEKQRFGTAIWGYYDTDGPLSFALYGAWHRSSVYGWNGNVYVGMRIEADSVVDFKRYVADYEDAYNAAEASANENGFGWNGANPYENTGYPSYAGGFGDTGYNGFDDNFGDWNWDGFGEDMNDSTVLESISVPIYKSYGKWIGPVIRSKISYRFRTKITLEGLMNLFYGFTVAGPDDDYKEIRKFNGTWGTTISWKPNAISFYCGMEFLYRWNDLPGYYKGVYARSGFLSEIKTGVKWNF